MGGAGKMVFPKHECTVASAALGPLGCQTMRLYTIAPYIELKNGGTLVIIGERNKVVPMSNNRIKRLELITFNDEYTNDKDQKQLRIEINAETNENVVFYGMMNGQTFEISNNQASDLLILDIADSALKPTIKLFLTLLLLLVNKL